MKGGECLEARVEARARDCVPLTDRPVYIENLGTGYKLLQFALLRVKGLLSVAYEYAQFHPGFRRPHILVSNG